MSLLELETKNFTISGFSDQEGETLTYSVTFLNGTALDTSYITFDPLTLKITVTAIHTIETPLKIQISATDGHNNPATSILTIETDFKPKINSDMLNLSGEFICLAYSTFSISSILFSDESMASLSYNLTYTNGTSIPNWLTFKSVSESTSGDFEISGNYPNFEYAIMVFTLTAKDIYNQTNSVNITITTRMV